MLSMSNLLAVWPGLGRYELREAVSFDSRIVSCTLQKRKMYETISLQSIFGRSWMKEVRRLRERKGWTQNQLAYHASTAPSVISLIETGKRDPNATTLRKLAEALGVEVPDLFRGSEVNPKAEAPQLRFEDLEELRREDPYAPWLEFANRCADRWEKRISSGDFDVGAMDEFIGSMEDLSPVMNRLGLQEKREQPTEYMYSFGPIMGEAIQRLMSLLKPLLEAADKKSPNAVEEDEDLRRRFDAIVAASGLTELDHARAE
jgi:transcriptional regulator with XRE-family HTH domain